MKLHRIFKISLFILIFSSYSTESAAQASSIELKDLEGSFHTLDDLKGSKLTVIDFWATWCKPCLKSIPKLVELSETYQEDEVAFVGINNDSPRNLLKVRPLARSLGITYPVLLDLEQELYGELLVGVLPTLLILNPDGEVLYTHEGFAAGDEKEIKAKIDELLEK